MMRGRPPKYDWNVLEPKIKEMLQSNMTYKEISKQLDIPFFSLAMAMSKKGITRINVVGRVSNTYSMVNSLMRKIRKNKEVDDAIDEVCVYYNVDPDELCEACNEEIDAVVQCYMVQRSYKRTAQELIARYGVKPCNDFITNALYFSGCPKISVTPDPPQPADAIFVPDPDGVYCGFWLTEEQAILLAEIRIKKRMEGDNQFESHSRIGIFQAEVGARIAKKW